MDYKEFLNNKEIKLKNSGIVINDSDINPSLFPFQRDITKWALKKGRCAIFLDTGLGKTFIQLEFARILNKPTLIIAPLSVAKQTIREGRKINIDVINVRTQDEIQGNHIYITNYEMVERFNPDSFKVVILDESSILKSIAGKTRRKLINLFQKIPYRLCCTATPAPNDFTEIGNHAEFLGICTMAQMLAMFFIHANKVDEQVIPIQNGNSHIIKTKQSNTKGQEWRLKNYGKEAFYKWLASWSVSIMKPSDLGYDDNGFILPPLNIISHFIPIEYKPDDKLFFTELSGIQDRSKIRKTTIDHKIKTALEIINDEDQYIVWCGLNDESKKLHSLLKDSVEIVGSDEPENKALNIERFQDGEYKILITKPKIAGFGMNFQNAHNMIFFGLNDSWEMYYQAIRRQWRFGQTMPVNVHIILTEIEREIYENIMKKETMAHIMKTELIKHIEVYEMEELNIKQSQKEDYNEIIITGNNWKAINGDSCEYLPKIETETIDLSVYSPPFADLYTYSADERDLGNSKSWDEFCEHYKFIIREIFRITKAGRITCVHSADIPALSMKDGYIGIKDFPGAVIKAHENEGWIFHGRAIVSKNPQAQAIRTHSKALLFVQLKKDSSDSRPAIFDQILIFKKPGDNRVPVIPVKNGEMDNETWINWAAGIWTDISESDTLRYSQARDTDDEKHICPLQLGTIERCIKLYSNPGEIILTPFLGIGSEAYQAIILNRKAIGIELKKSYFNIAVQNLKDAEKSNINLFNKVMVNG